MGTLSRTRHREPCTPRLPSTIVSARTSSATSTIREAGSPSSIRVVVATPGNRVSNRRRCAPGRRRGRDRPHPDRDRSASRTGPGARPPALGRGEPRPSRRGPRPPRCRSPPGSSSSEFLLRSSSATYARREPPTTARACGPGGGASTPRWGVFGQANPQVGALGARAAAVGPCARDEGIPRIDAPRLGPRGRDRGAARRRRSCSSSSALGTPLPEAALRVQGLGADPRGGVRRSQAS